MIKISIITTTYNSASTIRDTLESVVNQSYNNIEHIIIDGKSRDNTLAIIAEFPHVAKIVSESDKGIYDAMNKGIKLATGEVIVMLNSDDFYENNQVINTIVHCFEIEPQIDIVYGNISYVNHNDTNKVIRRVKSKPYYDNFFEDGEIVPHPTFFAKRKIYEKLGDYDFSFRLAADYEYTIRALKIHKFKAHYLDEFLVKMRMGGATTQNVNSIIKVNQEILRAFKKNKLKGGMFFMTKRIYKKLSQFG
jgi:glycosyltransferase involved in cell wall biosynthesis